ITSAEKMFPRSATRELPVFDEPPCANVLLVFETAPALQLERVLAVFVAAQLIDIEPEAVEISIRAVLGYEDSPIGLQELRGSKGLAIFQGVLDEAIMSTAIENAMFRVIDVAQGNSS